MKDKLEALLNGDLTFEGVAFFLKKNKAKITTDNKEKMKYWKIFDSQFQSRTLHKKVLLIDSNNKSLERIYNDLLKFKED